MHQPGRNVAIGSAIDSPPHCSGWSLERPYVRATLRERAGTRFRAACGTESVEARVLRQTGRRVCFVQKAETVPCGEELPHRSRL